MNREEYEIMFRVEDRHWWYVNLRNIVMNAWRTYGSGPGAAILDVGCGTGAILEMFNGVGAVTGIDYEPLALQFSKRRSITNLVSASAAELPFGPDHFDAIISLDVLGHKRIPDASRPLHEMHRLLKSGGLLILNLPAYQWLLSSHDKAVHTDKRFTKTEIRSLLHEARFDPLLMTYWNTIPFPPIAALRLWQKISAPSTSDLATLASPLTGKIMALPLALERAIIKVAPLPFGLSIFAVARKK